MLMGANKDKTAVHGCHSTGISAVRMRKILAKQQSRCQGPRFQGSRACDLH